MKSFTRCSVMRGVANPSVWLYASVCLLGALMRPRDLFGVAVRVIGIWFLTQACYWAFYGILKFNPGLGNPNIPQQEDVAMAAFYATLGVLLIVLADSVVRAVYGPQMSRQDGKKGP